MMYYANQTTGETTWDRPEPAVVEAPPPAPQPEPQSHQQTPTSTSSATPRKNKLASKYGDGFVTSASHPELASQYGNVGTRYELALFSAVLKPMLSLSQSPLSNS